MDSNERSMTLKLKKFTNIFLSKKTEKFHRNKVKRPIVSNDPGSTDLSSNDQGSNDKQSKAQQREKRQRVKMTN